MNITAIATTDCCTRPSRAVNLINLFQVIDALNFKHVSTIIVRNSVYATGIIVSRSWGFPRLNHPVFKELADARFQNFALRKRSRH
ncbi:hypothetical protein D3C85_1375170 [compost metagenome]